MENGKEVLAKVVQLRTQLVSQGHTRHLLADTDLMTLRIHCYSPGIGENALHAHTKEDHIFVVLEGTAQFNTGRDGKTVVKASKHQAIVLPAGCYYQFCNSGDTPLVMARSVPVWTSRTCVLILMARRSRGELTSRELRSRF
jgi:mannose-6-phosphate isomerase-like protein (cupin superfamily)